MDRNKNIDQLFCLAEMGRSSIGLFHDILNPISSLILYLDLISNKKDIDQKTKQELKPIINSTKKITSLIKDIQKDLSQKSTRKTVFSIDEVIFRSIKILSHKARKQSVSIIFIREKNVTISSHKIKIYQIIINLISNAIDSFETISDNRKRKVKILLEQNKNKIFVSVTDNGCGIKKEIQNTLFKKIYTTKSYGTGFGLYNTSKIITKDLHGNINMKSDLCVGTMFKIIIPKT